MCCPRYGRSWMSQYRNCSSDSSPANRASVHGWWSQRSQTGPAASLHSSTKVMRDAPSAAQAPMVQEAWCPGFWPMFDGKAERAAVAGTCTCGAGRAGLDGRGPIRASVMSLHGAAGPTLGISATPPCARRAAHDRRLRIRASCRAYLSSRALYQRTRTAEAGGQGFEPRYLGPEPSVLPLDDPPTADGS